MTVERRILITGAAGAIGRTLREGLRGRYSLLRLVDIAPLGAAQPGEEVVQADITDFDAMLGAMRDVDCVVHLAAVPVEDDWRRILPLNIEGTYNVFEAARRAGVRRMVYASSNHAVGFHRRERALDAASQPRPDGYYGVSKVFGEAMGRLYADKHGMEVACLRIGSFRPAPENERQLATWLSPRDMVQLARRCIDAGAFHFFTVYGVSANTRSNWDNSHAAFLGYAPEDNAEAFANERLAAAPAANPVEAAFHGGPFCAMDFDGDVSKID